MGILPIMAQLRGSRTASAEGITVESYTPAFELCRKLIEAGMDPKKPIVFFRNGEIALKVKSLEWGAEHTVEDDRRGKPVFKKIRSERLRTTSKQPSSGEPPEPSTE